MHVLKFASSHNKTRIHTEDAIGGDLTQISLCDDHIQSISMQWLKAMWQLQPKVEQTVQQHVSYRTNLSGHVTIFSWMITITCCLVVGLGLDLVSGW